MESQWNLEFVLVHLFSFFKKITRTRSVDLRRSGELKAILNSFLYCLWVLAWNPALWKSTVQKSRRVKPKHTIKNV